MSQGEVLLCLEIGLETQNNHVYELADLQASIRNAPWFQKEHGEKWKREDFYKKIISANGETTETKPTISKKEQARNWSAIGNAAIAEQQAFFSRVRRG